MDCRAETQALQLSTERDSDEPRPSKGAFRPVTSGGRGDAEGKGLWLTDVHKAHP